MSSGPARRDRSTRASGTRETPALLTSRWTGRAQRPSLAKAVSTASASAMSATAAPTVIAVLAERRRRRSFTLSLRSSAAMVAPSSPKKRQSAWPMPPAAPVMATVLPAKRHAASPAIAPRRSRRGWPGADGRNCRRRFRRCRLAQALDRREELASALSRSGCAGRRMPRSLPAAARAAASCPRRRPHAHGARLVEAGLDDAGGLGKRGEVAALVPGAAGRPRHRGDDRDVASCAPPRGFRRPAR